MGVDNEDSSIIDDPGQEVAAPVDFADTAALPFPVVGIGASAGGIEALSEFLAAMPADSGMALVIVQHLPPEHQSQLAEVLGRHTTMRVQEIKDGMTIAPNHVYVIRPGFTVTMEGSTLQLGESVE